MPSKSQAQHNMMEAAAHGASSKVPQAVAQEFVQADKGRTFKKPSSIASKTTNNTVKDPRSLVGFRPR